MARAWCQGIFSARPKDPHADLVDEHGMITLPIAAFLLRIGGKNVLLDAGMGPNTFVWDVPNGDRLELSGGALPRLLAEQGLLPEDIDYVMPTHLHGDHVGWLFPEGRNFFPNATIRFGEGDWGALGENAPNPYFREGMKQARDQGRIEYIEGDGELLPRSDRSCHAWPFARAHVLCHLFRHRSRNHARRCDFVPPAVAEPGVRHRRRR